MSCGVSLWGEPLEVGRWSCISRMTPPPIRGAHSFLPSFTDQEQGSLWGLAVDPWEGASCLEVHPGCVGPLVPLSTSTPWGTTGES